MQDNIIGTKVLTEIEEWKMMTALLQLLLTTKGTSKRER
jgi:hypothetical protein